MTRARTGGLSLALMVAAQAYAYAQPAPPAPQDPYAAPAGHDPVLAEQVAEQLVARAQELLDAKVYVDAKQLAVEALVKSPKGNAADRARFIIKVVNDRLGIKDEPPPVIETPVDVTPIEDPTKHVEKAVEIAPPVESEAHDGHIASSVHGAIYTGLVGSTLGSFFDRSNPAGGAIPVGIAAGIAGGLYLPRLFHSAHWDESQVRTVGAGSVWGGVIGGLFADTVMGANGGTVTAPGVLVGASIGSTLGVVAGGVMANNHTLTRGDVALVDTLAGIGTASGLTIGMLMQPAQKEAYALNAILGAAGGLIAGYVAGPQTNTTPRRMMRVAGLSALGGGLPFLLYAAIHKASSTADDRVTGALSTIGLVGGAWLGFYLTRDYEVGLDVPDGKTKVDDAPPAIVGRSSDGRWGLGGIGVQPLSCELAPQSGLSLSLVGATF
ncbi:MAG: hypothetical protein JWO36_1664 [Myxococcales bacterium]|nr:hypothetical protein [Myxococcales bacterium]